MLRYVATSGGLYTYSVSDLGQGAATVAQSASSVALQRLGFTVTDQEGNPQDDGITDTSTPTAVLTFSEPVFGQASDLAVTNSSSQTITPGSVSGWGTDALTLTFSSSLPDDQYTITLGSGVTDDWGHRLSGSDGTAQFQVDTVDPEVVSLIRTSPTTFAVQFNKNVSVSADAMSLYNQTTQTYVTGMTLTYNSQTYTATWTLPGAMGGGVYVITLSAGKVSDAGGHRPRWRHELAEDLGRPQRRRRGQRR